MNQRFKALTLTHHRASLAIREQLALDETGCRRLLRTLQEEHGMTDVLVLSTCNRTEVYYSAEADQGPAIIAELARLTGAPVSAELAACFANYLRAEAAVLHLFEVSLGLDAQVLGDQQIIGQVKQAYQWSADADAAGPFLHRLLHTVFFAHKRVRQETDFHTGAASVAHAARALVEGMTAHLTNPRVLVVGAGALGTDVARECGGNHRFLHVTLCNRTPDRAGALAAELGIAVLNFADVARGVQEADVVICCVAAPGPLLTRQLLAQRPVLSHKFLVDLSVPRSIEAAVEEVPGVLLYTLDDIHPQTTAAEARRRAAVPLVQAIIAESVADLREWSSEWELSPTIQLLKNALEQLRQEEVQRFGKKISVEQAALLDEVTRALMQKVLKQPVRHLKAACRRGETGPLVELLTDLFDLDKHRVLDPVD